MKYGEYDVPIDGGKYRFRADGVKKLEALRHGEPWPGGQQIMEDMQYSKFWTALMMEHQEARDALYLMRKLFTDREIASAMERRGMAPDNVGAENYTLGLMQRAMKRSEEGRE